MGGGSNRARSGFSILGRAQVTLRPVGRKKLRRPFPRQAHPQRPSCHRSWKRPRSSWPRCRRSHPCPLHLRRWHGPWRFPPQPRSRFPSRRGHPRRLLWSRRQRQSCKRLQLLQPQRFRQRYPRCIQPWPRPRSPYQPGRKHRWSRPGHQSSRRRVPPRAQQSRWPPRPPFLRRLPLHPVPCWEGAVAVPCVISTSRAATAARAGRRGLDWEGINGWCGQPRPRPRR